MLKDPIHSRLCLCMHEKNTGIIFQLGVLATLHKYRHSYIEIRRWRQNCEGSRPYKKNSVNNTVRIRLHLPGVIVGRHNILCKTKLNMTIDLTRRFRIVCHLWGFFLKLTYRFWGQVTHSISNLPSKLHQLLWRQICLWFDIWVFVVSVF